MDATTALERLATITERQLTPGQAIDEAVTLYLELGSEIADLENARAAAKLVISDVIVETGLDRFEVNAGMAYVSKPSVRISYDTKGLDKLAAERPDLAGILALYRTEKEIAGTLTIRAAGGNGKS
jgi:hypothetical protein